MITSVLRWNFLTTFAFIQELSLDPGKCTGFSFVVPGATQFNVSVDAGQFPDDCSPVDSLNITQIWRKGKCVDYKWWNILCKNAISDIQQTCSQWGKLAQKFSPTDAAGSKVQQMTYWECGEIEYYMAFTSSCASPAKLSIDVDIGALEAEEAKFCNIVGVSGKNLYEKFTMGRLYVLVVGMLAIYGLVVVIVCVQIPCCTLHRLIKSGKSNIDDIEEELLEEDEEEVMERRKLRTHRLKAPISKQPPIPE